MGWRTARLHKKGGIVHSEILLPTNAPPTLINRSELWNSVELFEKPKDAQLARDIEIALPVELDRKAQLELVRTYVNDTFVSVGMCADFALHDKGDGNPHAHILLTFRPLKEDGTWGAKCRKEYDLDENGQRIRSESGAYKSHRVDSTDWNHRGKAEQWRSAWSDYVNRSLEQNGIKERVDHRSYKRQGIDKIPSVHLGVAAYDNAVAENFFSCLKCKLVHLQCYATRAAAEASIFSYVEAFYNTIRPHSALGWLSPSTFERHLNATSVA